MLIILNKRNSDIAGLKGWLITLDVLCRVEDKGDFYCIECTGNTNAVDDRLCNAYGSATVIRNNNYTLQDGKKKTIKVGDVIFGSDFVHIAGPCTVEGEDDLLKTAVYVKQCGAKVLRGGAFKPRTSPYTFQGLGKKGIDILCRVAKKAGLLSISEIMSETDIGYFADVDILQIGAKNMYNYSLLKQLSHCNKPILLKRNVSASVSDWLFAAEYLLQGNSQVILCERGVRNICNQISVDLAGILEARQLSGLPIIADVSHAAQSAKKAIAFARGVVACGVDGIMVETTAEPLKCVCDGVQSLTLDEYGRCVKEVESIRRALTDTL